MVNRLRALLKYHTSVYIKSSKYVMPIVLWLICMQVFYTMIPVFVVSSFVTSMGFLFFIMVWVGRTYTEIEDSVSEQLLILKVKSEHLYYMSKIVFLSLVGTVFAVVGLVYPLLQNVLTGYRLYTRPITMLDVVSALVLHILVAVLGGMVGTIFHHRIMKERRIGVILTFSLALMSIVKGALIQDLPVSRIIMWVFPPLYDTMVCFRDQDYFVINGLLRGTLYIVTYTGVLIALQLYLLKRNKFQK